MDEHIFSQKKILFMINNLSRGGAERCFLNQINYINAKYSNVYLVTLLKEKENNSYFNELCLDKNKIFYINFKNPADIKKYYILSKIIKKNKIDIVYSTLEHANIIARILKIYNPRVKIFIRESNIADKKILKFKILDIFLNPLSEKIIAVSNEVKNSLVKYQKIYKNKIIIIPNGSIIPTKLKNYEKNNKNLKILNIGRFTEQKGHLFLLEAMNDLKKEGYSNIHLTIVGDGTLKKKMEDFIRENNLESSVSLRDIIEDRNILEEVYLNSDLFILSSLWEGFPNALLEAMSYGIVPVATDISGTREVIKDGVSGYLIKPGSVSEIKEKIRFILNNPDVLNSISENSHNRIKCDYSLENQIINLIKNF